MNKIYRYLIVSTLGLTLVPGTSIAQNKFMGVGSCSSSNCHGGTSARKGTNVMQNEYVTWYKHGSHSKAWQVLTNSDSKKIAEHLGIADASKEPLCLKCHSTYVPDAALHGDKYNIDEGVSCESCHGAAEQWIKAHTDQDASHQKNVELGLNDLNDIGERAKLCLSCHYGNEEKTVNHKMIGAGHPRLSFELDTFSMIQPRHWEYDADYIKRKVDYVSTRTWLVGQAVIASENMKALNSAKRSKDGIWPELTLFTCYSCHHSLVEDQWKKRRYARPGQLRLNVSSLITLSEALSVIKPEYASALLGNMDKLHEAYKSGNGKEIVNSIQDTIDKKVLPFLKTANYNKIDAKKLLKKIVNVAADTPHFQYEEAEQLAMGISAILALPSINSEKYKPFEDGIYDALANPEDFTAEKFTLAARKFHSQL
ncbi:MAG: hypothetical protein H6619_04520 [Deltaproteobacteria bacterium]|nr:hypothetical protein [Deltaproteobacteria bacterium]